MFPAGARPPAGEVSPTKTCPPRREGTGTGSRPSHGGGFVARRRGARIGGAEGVRAGRSCLGGPSGGLPNPLPKRVWLEGDGKKRGGGRFGNGGGAAGMLRLSSL